jgi:uncharacterized protein YndB with AHSA1/START domain
MASTRQATSAATSPSEAALTLVLRRVLKAPPERVFRAWTEPEQLARWFGPRGFTCPEHAIDPRPGGAYRVTMRSPEGTLHTVSGTYTAVEPPRRLAFTWAWEQEGARGHESAVELALSAHPEGTELVLTHRRHESVEARDRHTEGWSSCLDKLVAYVAAG